MKKDDKEIAVCMNIEDIVRKIIREEITKALEELKKDLDPKNYRQNKIQLDQYPDALTIQDVSEILRIGIRSTYELARQKDFPTIKIGRRSIVPKHLFIEWIKNKGLEPSQL